MEGEMKCSINNCKGTVTARGWCRKHYLRWYKHGDPLKVKKAKVKTGPDASTYKHGYSDHPLYKTWHNMMSRCYNEKNHAYLRYGGEGITVCDRWHNVENFILDMGDRDEGLSIDRIDSNGNYCPENCRWASDKTQSRNRPDFVKLTMKKAKEIRELPRRLRNGRGEGLTRKQIADMYDVSVATIKKVLSNEYWTQKV